MNDQRSPKGTFAKGHPGGPGRPRRAVEDAYLVAISEACSPEKWKQIVERAVEEALGGDARAREWLAGCLVGKPHDEGPLVRLDLARTILDEVLGE